VDRSAALPRAPSAVLGPTGAPRLGAYQGWLGTADLGPLRPEGLLASLRHAARERRWHQVVIATAGHLLVVGIQDGGTLAGGSVWLTARAGGEPLLARSAAGVAGVNARVGPRPGPGARAAFAAPRMELSLERRSDRFQLRADLGAALQLEAYLETRGAPEPLALVAPLPEGGLRAVQLSGPLAVAGTLTLGGAPLPLAGGLAAIDFTAGVFPRTASWRRLTAVGRLGDGRAVALHLAEGLSGAEPGEGGEDVLLAGAGPLRLPPVVFEAASGPPEPGWRAASADGAVELAFRPVASQAESRDLLLVSSRVRRQAGVLSGRVPGPDGAQLDLDGLPALAEDLEARW
jgi:hypothetical protein